MVVQTSTWIIIIFTHQMNYLKHILLHWLIPFIFVRQRSSTNMLSTSRQIHHDDCIQTYVQCSYIIIDITVRIYTIDNTLSSSIRMDGRPFREIMTAIHTSVQCRIHSKWTLYSWRICWGRISMNITRCFKHENNNNNNI